MKIEKAKNLVTRLYDISKFLTWASRVVAFALDTYPFNQENNPGTEEQQPITEEQPSESFNVTPQPEPIR